MLLSQALQAGEQSGSPLPNLWPSLVARGAQIRRGEVTMIAAPSGAGKSMFALSTVLRIGRPTLYLSADTSAHTAAVRLAAMVTGATQESCEQNMQIPGWADDVLAGTTHIRWSFEGAPTLDVIDMELAAYEEVFGRCPEAVVLDNLMDSSEGDDEWGGIRQTNKELRWLARQTEAAFIVLHHTNESERDSEGAPPRWRIQGRDTRPMAVIFTLGQVNEGTALQVAVVKSRGGLMDPAARDPITFAFDPSRAWIGDYLERDR